MIYGDYHTHTIYSHGKGTILENAEIAKQKGISEIAITDHGFNHILYGVNRKYLNQMKKEAKEAEDLTGVKVYLGVEANICSKKGKVDVKKEDLKYLDILVMGYHKAVRTGAYSFVNFILPNWSRKAKSVKRIKSNTDAFIRAIREYPVDIISHINHRANVDVVEVAKVASEVGCYIELNGRRRHISKEQVQDIVHKTDAMFVLDSDAHHPDNVGNVEMWHTLAEEYGIPEDRIANLSSPIKLRDKKAFYEK